MKTRVFQLDLQSNQSTAQLADVDAACLRDRLSVGVGFQRHAVLQAEAGIFVASR